MGGEEVPEGLSGVAARQMERDRTEVLRDPTANLEEVEAQGAELEVGHAEPSQPAADGIQQPVGGAVQQEAELVGPERVAAQAIGEAALLEIFDAEFGAVAAAGIPGVEFRGGGVA